MVPFFPWDIRPPPPPSPPPPPPRRNVNGDSQNQGEQMLHPASSRSIRCTCLCTVFSASLSSCVQLSPCLFSHLIHDRWVVRPAAETGLQYPTLTLTGHYQEGLVAAAPPPPRAPLQKPCNVVE